MKSFKKFIKEQDSLRQLAAPDSSLRPRARPTGPVSSSRPEIRPSAPTSSIRPEARPARPPEKMMPTSNPNFLNDDPAFGTPDIYKRDPNDPNRPVPLVPRLDMNKDSNRANSRVPQNREGGPTAQDNYYLEPYRDEEGYNVHRNPVQRSELNLNRRKEYDI